LNGSMPGVAEGANPEDGMKEKDLKADSIVKSNQEQAVKFLGKLFNLSKQDYANDPMELERAVIRMETLIKAYALKGSTSGHVSPENIQAAVEELWNALGSYADQAYGDNNGEVSQNELLKMGSKGSTNPVLIALTNLHEGYKNIGNPTEE
jgi:hypothetical protein